MRKRGEAKRGALTVEAAEAKASQLIREFGSCLFLMDIVESTNYGTGGDPKVFQQLLAFLKELNESLSEYLPLNTLSVGESRPEKGFVALFGDAVWGGINNPKVIPAVEALRRERYPELRLYYGVAKDGWSEGMELVK